MTMVCAQSGPAKGGGVGGVAVRRIVRIVGTWSRSDSSMPDRATATMGALALAAAVTLAGCGTTVPRSEREAAQSTGLGATSASTAATAATAGGSAASGVQTLGATGLAGAAVATDGTPGAGNSPAATSGPAIGATTGSSLSGTASSREIPPTGRGWDTKHVYIGVTTEQDFEATASSLGYGGIDPGDTSAQATAFADDINRHGGLFGRTVVLSFIDVPSISTAENPDPEAQAVCTEFTQDRPVIAVVNIVTILDGTTLRSCLAQAGVPLFNGSDAAMDNQAAQSLSPYLYSLVAPSWNLLAPALILSLKAQGYFGGWNSALGRPDPTKPVKVGVLTDDTSVGGQVSAIITKALTAAGYPGAVAFQYAPPGSDIFPAILYFAGHGVTHIISDDIELSAFQLDAQTQDYVPRYGITTYNDPYANLQKVAPAAQNTGDVGIGWAPTYDVSASNDPGPVSSAETSCAALETAAGVQNSDRLADAFGYVVCDGIRLVADAAGSGGGFSPLDLYRGSVEIGAGFHSAFTFSSGLSATNLTVPDAGRPLAYVASCSCFRYGSHTSIGW